MEITLSVNDTTMRTPNDLAAALEVAASQLRDFYMTGWTQASAASRDVTARNYVRNTDGCRIGEWSARFAVTESTR